MDPQAKAAAASVSCCLVSMMRATVTHLSLPRMREKSQPSSMQEYTNT